MNTLFIARTTGRVRRHVRRFLAALLTVAAATSALADNPVNGASLYASRCASCHGNSPLTSNANKIYNARNARAVTDAAINSVGDMNSLRTAFPAGGTALADLAAYLGNTPTGMTFASTAVGSASASQTFTVYASLKTGNAISGLAIATSGDFARAGGTCGTAVATGTSCTVLVNFTPTATGARAGTLSVTHGNTASPISIALNGTATGGAPPVPAPAPVATLSPASITLASTAIGGTSASQSATLTNTGNAALAISSIATSDSANFVIAGGTCSAGGSVAAGSSCTVAVAFAPAAGATGARNATLSIGHNAAGSPGSVALSGTATAALAPGALLTSALSFGSVNVTTTSPVQTATLANTGTAALTVSSLSTANAEFLLSGGTCSAGGSVAAGSSCTVNVAFTPAAAGSRSASLTIAHNAPGGQSTSSLSGTGVALTPVIGVSPPALSFTQTVASTSAAQSITLSNSGNANLTLGTLTLGGAQAAEYTIAAGTTCSAGATVGPNSSCLIKVTFLPTVAGQRAASLTITHNAAGSPTVVALSGNGTTTPQPAISLNATTLVFGPQTLGSASAAQSVTVINSGSAALTLAGLTLAGTSAGEFTRSGTCSAGVVLSNGASCQASFVFTPAAVGSRTATLTIASDATNGSAALSLAGTGAAVPVPSVALAPSTLAFGNQTSGTASAARTVTLSNTGSGTLTLSGVTATTGFSVTHNCGSSVAAAGSCVLSIVFTPTTVGTATGSVAVASNAPGTPHAVSLGGAGVAASPVLAWSPAAAALAFGDVAVGATPAARSLMLVNQGPGSVALQQFTLAGVQAADFSIGAGSTCATGATLTQGASCALALTFQPGAAGARAAVLQVTSSGTNPPDVALSGNGSALAQPAATVSPTALNFTLDAPATAADPQSLNLLNSGGAVLHVDAVRVVAGSFTLSAAASGGCPVAPFDLMPAQSCTITVGWSSNAVGTEAGSVEIATVAAAPPVVVALQATRNAAAATAAAPAPAIGNAGGGGCSIARGESPLDPVLAVLALIAAGVLWRRRATRSTDGR